MKIVAKKDRKLLLINTGNTQNENKAETIELTVPEEYEDYNKKIVFVTENGIVWDIIQDNTYKLTKAITKYKQVDFYIWLTKDDVDFRTETRPLRFYYNKDASDEITPEEISGVNTVVNILEEEITKVDSLETELRDLITDIQNKLDNGEFDGKDGYTPQKGIDYFTEQDIEEIEGDILNEVYTKSETDTLLEEKADIEDIPDVSSFITKDVNNLTNYTLKTNTGSLIDLEINNTTYVVTLKLKNQDGTVISTDTIDLPLESVVVSGRYDNTTKKVILTLENGSEVDFSVADLVAGLQTEITSSNKLASDLVDDTNSGNKFVTTTEKQTWNNKLDESDLTDYVKNTDYASSSKGGVIKATGAYGVSMQNSGAMYATNTDFSTYQNVSQGYFIGKGTLENVIAGKQLINQTQLEESQETQDEEIEKLQTENARLKATLPTTTGEGQDITLNKTAELEFKKPPLPMGNSEQFTTTGKNLFNYNVSKTGIIYNINNDIFTFYRNAGSDFLIPFNELKLKTNTNYVLYMNIIENTMTSNFVLVTSASVFLQGSFSIGIGQTGIKTAEVSTASSIDNLLYDLWFYCNGSGSLKANVMLVEGTTQGEYEPYTGGQASPNPDYPQSITNVTGDVEVVVENKNLFDKGNIKTTNYYIQPIAPNPGEHIPSLNNRVCEIEVEPNTDYTRNIVKVNNMTFWSSITFYDKDHIFISGLWSPDNVITTPSNAKYMILSTSGNVSSLFGDELVLETYYNSLQLEKGTTPTNYVKHKGQTLPLTLGSIELCKIGDYQDYFYKESNKWYLHKEIGKYTIPNNVGGYNSASNWYYIGIGQFSNIKTNSGTEILCNYLQNINLALDANINKSGIYNIGTHIVLRNIDLSSTSDYQTWISNNKILYSLLETPTDTEITDTTLISQLEAINNALSYEEQTNIRGSSNGNNPIFTVEGYQSTKLVLQDFATAIVALGGV